MSGFIYLFTDKLPVDFVAYYLISHYYHNLETLFCKFVLNELSNDDLAPSLTNVYLQGLG